MSGQVTYSWIPSTARIIVISAGGAICPSAFCNTSETIYWPIKDPLDVLDYVVDLSQVIAGNVGDAVATLQVQIAPANPGDLTLVSSSADGDQVVLWFSQGFAGTTYAITLTIGTNSGRVIGRTLYLPVQALATPPIPVESLVDQNGNPIIDQSGDPITVSE